MIRFISVELQPFLERALADPRLDPALVLIGKGVFLGRTTASAWLAVGLLKIQLPRWR